MNRRNAISVLSILAARSVVTAPLVLSACSGEETAEVRHFFTAEEMELLAALGESILPRTADAPGATDAGVAAFADRYVADCLTAGDQTILRLGLKVLDEAGREPYGHTFLRLSDEERHDLLVAVDIEAEQYQQQATAAGEPHYFSLLKGLVLLGYFTSEAGATQALRYVAVPGKYEGNIPYQPGDSAWAI